MSFNTELPGVLQPFSGVSFFQWQIEQEESCLSGLSPEALRTQDREGDTFLHIAIAPSESCTFRFLHIGIAQSELCLCPFRFLHIAVAHGRRALAFVLARRMAGLGLLDAKEHNGQTALQLGVAANQHLIVEDLIGHGAQINTVDRWGRSPLHVSAENGFLHSLQSFQRALHVGWSVSVEVFNYQGLTPLQAAVLSHNALVKELRTAVQAGELLQKKKLLIECVKTLLLMGASYGTKDLKSGRSSLYMAAEEANVELLQLFLDQPSCLAIINTKAFDGNTALHVASCLSGRTAQVAAVRLLMGKGADPGAKNLDNETPVQLVPEGPMGDKVRRVLKGRDVCA
ncbi:NF-kappa-B inhibitor zeta-like [Aplochiton taeniatus]